MVRHNSHSRLVVGLFALFVCLVTCASAQQEDDSLRFYKKLKKVAYKNRFTRMAYDAIFVDPEPKEYPMVPTAKEEKHVNPYLLYPGKIIRRVNIEVLDPFGTSVNDTTRRKINAVQQMGNYFHITTHRRIIYNRLLFHEHDSINPLALSETERILREWNFVNDARVFISPTPSRDSVDVNVIVLDKWPLVIPVVVTDVSASATVRNKNLFGTGQQFEQHVGFHRPDVYEASGNYNLTNIGRSYISSSLGYSWNKAATNTYLSFDRPFFSPLAKWAGGLSLSHNWSKFPYSSEGRQTSIPVTVAGYDVWGGKNFKLSRSGSLFNQSTNIMAGLRQFYYGYLNRPNAEQDPGRSFRSWGAVLGNVGFAIQQYYKEKFVYRFGANEDVPEGLIVQTTYGYFQREFSKPRFYNGIEVARARHYSFGYLSASAACGVYYNKGVTNDVTEVYKLYYFSDLLRGGKWFFRQFVRLSLIHGENKQNGETITLQSDELYGFSNGGLSGNTKMVFNSETVAYMPYSFIGFRFAPVVMAGLGMIGTSEQRMIHNRIYQGYSLGILVRNENLLNSTFQISAGFYPYLPDGRQNVLLYNPVTSFTLRVRGFSVSRPDFIAY